MVFDVYIEQSIKSATRSKKGQTKQIKVAKGTPLLRNWKSFRHVDGNKTELFHLLAEKVVTETGFQELVITRGNQVLWNSSELNKTQLAHATTRKQIPGFLYTSRIWPVKIMR